MKVIASSIRKGNVIEQDGKLYVVLTAENIHPDRQQPEQFPRVAVREAAADGGGRFEAVASIEVAQAAAPALGALTARLGARLSVLGEAGRKRGEFEVARR